MNTKKAHITLLTALEGATERGIRRALETFYIVSNRHGLQPLWSDERRAAFAELSSEDAKSTVAVLIGEAVNQDMMWYITKGTTMGVGRAMLTDLRS